MERFFPPQGSSWRMSGWTPQGHLGPAALPGVGLPARPQQSSPWESRKPSRCLQPPPSCLSASWEKTLEAAGCVQRAGKGSLSRTSFRFPQRSLTLLAQQHHHYKTCGNKSHYSPTICFNPLMEKMVSP